MPGAYAGADRKVRGLGEGEVGIVAANEGERRHAGIARDGCGVFDEDGGGAGGFEEWGVALVGEEGDLAGLRVVEARNAGDFDVGVCAGGRIEAAIEFLGKLRQLHGSGSCC